VEGRRQFWEAMLAVAERGKMILFATHYLEEADANADRVVLLTRGRIVADGPATEIKGRVGARAIRATLPGVDVTKLTALPGVLKVARYGDSISLSCSNTDAALAALLRAFPAIRDVEVHGPSLEEAFLELTVDHDREDDRDAPGSALMQGKASR
jgi:ABC-2 type transport system ATP-binding protein